MASKHSEFPFGKPGDEWSNWAARRRRSPRRFDAEVRPRLRELWDAGDWMVRDNILAYLVKTAPDEGWDLVWEALSLALHESLPDEERSGLQSTAVIVVMSYVHKDRVVTDQQVDRLRQILLLPGSDTTRGLTYQLLLWYLRAPDYWQLVDALTRDSSPEMRFTANMELLRAGRDVKAALLEDLDKQRYPDYGVEQLWSGRNRLNLTEGEEAWLRERCMKLLAQRRQWAAEPDSPDAHGLANWLQKGLQAEEGDIDLIARGALSGRMNYLRLMAVRDVAWFGDQKARAWLEAMTQKPYRGAVRLEARRQLKKLDASQQDGQTGS